MRKSTLIGTVLAGVAVVGLSGAASAATVNFSGVVTDCTPTCLSFPFLDTGSELNGQIDFGSGFDDGVWDGGDVTVVSATVLNPGIPVTPPSDPPNPAVDNPFTLDQTPEGGGIVVANGQDITNPRGTFPSRQSMGTQDGAIIDSGFLDLWLTQGLLANNGAIITLDFTSNTWQVAIFEGLIFVAGGTFENELVPSIIPVPAAAWLFGSALFGLLGLRRRAA